MTDNQNKRASIIEQARAQYACDDLEIDDDAKVSRIIRRDGKSDTLGAWVQAWVWVEGGNS
jgi:hypothetical protein